MDIAWSIPFILGLFTLFSDVSCGVYKIDVTVWQDNRYVNLTGKTNAAYRGYISPYLELDTFNIGRTSDTGTGHVGKEVVNPSDGTLPDSSGFPQGSTVSHNSKIVGGSFRRIDINLQGSNRSIGRVGAFYVKAVTTGGESVQITTIKTAMNATIIPNNYAVTKTTSVGDSVSLEVQSDLSDLRWSHNGGSNISEWQGNRTVVIADVRKADEGIYECYQDGQRERGVHAIMRLIVRGCPKSKYGSECLKTCPVCYNGGVCHDDNGVCVCPPGFQGDHCEQACDNNHWGASCSIICGSNTNCNGTYLCVPDPVGCSCHNGFMGHTCSQGCDAGFYGSDCTQPCHCSTGCSETAGCTDTSSCIDGYSGSQCQVPSNCSEGYFGDLCNYQCHCLNGTACDRDSGECIDGQCANGWGGSDCQQALPALIANPVAEVVGTTATIRWQTWNASVDYGTGPAANYTVYYGEHGQGLPNRTVSENTTVALSNLKNETHYEFAISVGRVVDGSYYEGRRGNMVTNITGCGVPAVPPTISSVDVLGSQSVEVHWKVPSGKDWIKCSHGIKSFIITYNPADSPDNKTVLHVNGSTIRQRQIDGLNPCTKYEIVIRVTNRDSEGPDSNISATKTDTVAPGRVQSLIVTPVSYDTVHLSWEKPTSQCEISFYNITHQAVLLDQCNPPKHPPVVSSNTTNLNATITGLEPYSNYTITVLAVSADVPGASETLDTQTGETGPSGVPANIVSNSSMDAITFKWERPKCGSRRGKIDHYEYMFGKDIVALNSTVESTESYEVTFKNLTRDTKYEFKIRANASAGVGPYSDVINVNTSLCSIAPSKVPSFKVTPVSYESLNVSWSAPSSVCEITSYVVVYQLTLLDQCRKEHQFSNSSSTRQTNMTITGLESYSTYNITVRAMAGQFPGRNKTLQGTTMPMAPTGIPLNITFTAYVDQLNFTWEQPSCGTRHGNILKYEYKFGKKGKEKKGSTTSNKIVFGNLTSGTKYSFNISADTSAGQGPYTDAIYVSTKGADKGNTTGIAVGVTIAVIFVVVAVIVVIKKGVPWWRRRREAASYSPME